MAVNEDSGTILFHMENRAATHLGRKLYSTTPPALAELIANSYDAYATKACVTINHDINYIVVADDGIGMSLSSLREKYAPVGREKRKDPAPEGFSPRDPMGQKGIGKLASFSLGDSFEVYTKVDGDQLWRHFEIQYSDFVQEGTECPVESGLTELPDYLNEYSSYQHGFITVIHDLRRGINQQTLDFLQTQLSRRFYIRADADNFKLIINGEEIGLSRNAYYRSMDYATYVGFSEDEISSLFDLDDASSMELVAYDWGPLKDERVKAIFDKLVHDKKLKGWIGTVEQPKQLKQHGNNTNIVVYINRKIADEDVLKDHPSSMMANQYVVGEFFADYLSEDAEDPITSSRQGLDNADIEVKELIDLIRAMRSTVLNSWNERRESGAIKRLPGWVAENEAYQTWIDGLRKPQRRLHDRLLKTLTIQLDDADEQDDARTRMLLNSFIDVVENNAIFELADDFQSDDDKTQDEILVAVAELLGRISASESIKQANIIAERLRAIRTLEDMMADDTTLEKAFERHLADNPWLINPYWNKSQRPQSLVKVVTQEFNKLYTGKSDEYRRTYIDICVYVADVPYPVIVELKRNAITAYSKVTYSKIYDQITDYRRAIRQKLALEGSAMNEQDIPAYFIASEDIGVPGQGNAIEISLQEQLMLRQQNITLISYRDLVNHAKLTYQEHIGVVEERHDLPLF